MRKVSVIRHEKGDTGVFSDVSTGTFYCYCVEPPNPIPAGTYRAAYSESAHLKDKDGKPKKTYLLEKVKGHEGIRLHNGNWAGDVTKGLKSSSEDCLILGSSIMDICGQKGVSDSVRTVARFEDDLEREPFEITISWADGVGP